MVRRDGIFFAPAGGEAFNLRSVEIAICRTQKNIDLWPGHFAVEKNLAYILPMSCTSTTPRSVRSPQRAKQEILEERDAVSSRV